jgi:CRP/FNR family transcriptional regulator
MRAGAPWPELRFYAGERIVAQGDAAPCLFVVRRGVVKLSSVSVEGREAILALVGPGQAFGERALVRDAPGMPAATAATDCAVSAVHAGAMSDPAELWVVATALASRLWDTTADLERLLHHGPRVRLAGILARLAERHGAACEGRFRIGIPLTQRELASMVGASRETVNRSLATLCALGWVHRRGRTLVVDDLEAMRRLGRAA